MQIFLLFVFYSDFSSKRGTKHKIVPGLVFDRYVSIWLENTDFAGAAADREPETYFLHILQILMRAF